jgi:hypothetical protein
LFRRGLFVVVIGAAMNLENLAVNETLSPIPFVSPLSNRIPTSRLPPTSCTVSAYLQPRNQRVKAGVFLHLTFDPLKPFGYKFRNLPATQASHVNMVPAQSSLVVVYLATDMRSVKLVNQSLSLQQTQCAIHRAAIDAGVQFLCSAQNLASIQMLAGRLHYPQDGASLLRHSDAALE